MKKNLIILMFVSQFAIAASLTSVDQVESFDCTLTSAAGVTKLKYEANQKYLVKGVRNNWIPVQYNLNSAGQNYQTGNSHISLSGGGLLRNQFLSLSATTVISSETSTASGSILLSTLGGSVFAPQQLSAVPVGQFYCTSIVIK